MLQVQHVSSIVAAVTTTTTPLERELHGGTPAPRATPVEAFRLARRRFVAGERLDMQQLASELGLHRTTLYRWVGTRDRLLGEILWSLAEPALREAARPNGLRGGERIARGIERYVRATLEAPFMGRFLTEEPEIALRVLTSKDSVVQARSVAWVQGLIDEEVELGELEPPLPAEDLAYLIVRIGESFLYTDLMTGGQPSPENAGQAVAALLR
jgi:AcrR family transcriptional regulator